MTIGERIARIRKENNLSQEAFGEALGVTRQAISKWEADANIPDVDKLMTISRLYGISVGYILGMEEETTSKTEKDSSSGTGASEQAGGEDRTGRESEQLTREQLRMVEEIVKRYIDAMSKAGAQTADRSQAESIKAESQKKPRRFRKILGIMAVIAVVIYFYNTLGTMRSQYQNLQNNLWQVQNALNNQSANLTYQINEILKDQNALLVDHGYEIQGYDLAEETITLSMYAEPKIYAPGMKVCFGTNSGGQELTVEATAEGHRYTGQITCALTDSISMFVRIERDGVTETQIMDYLGGMRLGSVPNFGGVGVIALWGDKIGAETTRIQDVVLAYIGPERDTKIGDATITDICSVLYINHQEYQVFALSPDKGEYMKIEDDSDGRVHYSAPVQLDIPLREGDTVTFTTRVTDSYGRQFEEIDSHYVIRNGEFDMDDYPQMEELQQGE